MTTYRITIEAHAEPRKILEVSAPDLRAALITAADSDPRDRPPGRPVAAGHVKCPGCDGMGEHQESYSWRGQHARVIDCTTCDGRGIVVASPLPYQLPVKPADWNTVPEVPENIRVDQVGVEWSWECYGCGGEGKLFAVQSLAARDATLFHQCPKEGE